MADQYDRRAALLGKADQGLGGGAHLCHGARRRFNRVGPHGLNRIDHNQPGDCTFGKGCDDVFNRCLSRELHWRIRQPEPIGAQADLGYRLLAGNVNDAVAGAGE